MALSIEAACVNCFACLEVCPSEAILEAKPHFLIDAKKCSECEGDFAEPQCASICPIEEAILAADGAPLNPLGSLTGIPVPRLLELARQSATL
jgi:ferredoxin